MNEPIETRQNRVLRLLQSHGLENVVVHRRSAARESSQRRASAKISVLRKCMLGLFHNFIVGRKNVSRAAMDVDLAT
jgi:hypothetical protein